MENEETKDVQETGAETKVLTFQEQLDSNKEYKSAFDKAITKATETAIENARAKWEQEKQAQIEENKKLATMDEIQKKDFEIEKLTKELNETKSNQNAINLMNETLKQAGEKGIPLELFSDKIVDYKHESAETIALKLSVYENTITNIANKTIAEYSKEKAPQTGEPTPTKEESQMTYEELCKLSKYN